jgi:hypothetical protein
MREQIELLLTAPESGAEAPTLARMEDTLTEGYARALALEAERWRLERRLGEVARTVEGPGVSSFADELKALAKGLTHTDRELKQLRTVLGSLHERTRAKRLAAETF